MRSPTVLFMSDAPLAAPERYALTSRIAVIQRDLSSAGLEVVIVAPDGIWIPDPNAKSGASREIGAGPKRRRVWEMDSLALSSLATFLRALRRLRRLPSQQSIIVVAQGIWTAAFARVLFGLHPQALLHLDVPGIPDREVKLAKPRMWRTKLRVYGGLFAAEIAWSDVISTINLAHADYIKHRFGRQAFILPDRLDFDWLQRLLSIPEKHPGDTTRLLYVGSISRSRLDMFFASTRPLLKEARITIDIVGDGPDLPRHKSECEALGVRFHGYLQRNSILGLLEEADICYSDVWSEIGTPYKLLEYMAAGKAVVTHDTPSTRELITNSVDGILCSSDQHSLTAAVQNLAASPVMRAKLGTNARNRIASLHLEHYGAKLVREYEALVRSRTEATNP